MKQKQFVLVFIILLCFTACSPIELDDGIKIEEKSVLSQQVATASNITSPLVTQKPIDIPVQYIAKKEEVNPFSDTIFALDPLENQPPRFGVIYANLPNDVIVKLWLRYYDESGNLQGIILHEPVKKGIVRYLFDLSKTLPDQVMQLEVSLRLDDPDFPQPESVTALLGQNGEYLQGTQVFEREWGGQYAAAQWELSWPEAVDDSMRVYISETGAKYHKQSCRHYRSSMLAVLPEIAKMQGYGACSVCGK